MTVRNRETFYVRTRAIVQQNLPAMREWAAGIGRFFPFRETGALCLMKYESPRSSFELCERIRLNRSVLIVPGARLGLEGYLRIWLGGRSEFTEGLRRIGIEFRAEMEHANG